jgi:hypothetical protein
VAIVSTVGVDVGGLRVGRRVGVRVSVAVAVAVDVAVAVAVAVGVAVAVDVAVAVSVAVGDAVAIPVAGTVGTSLPAELFRRSFRNRPDSKAINATAPSANGTRHNRCRRGADRAGGTIGAEAADAFISAIGGATVTA